MAAYPTAVHRSARSLASVAIIVSIAFLYHRVIATLNHTTVALTLLLAILGIAAGWGLTEAILASVFAVLCFNYFFLPPVGTFTIADPQNWIALLAFLLTAVIGSQLSVRAKRRAAEAVERRLEVERLYALGQAMLFLGDLHNVPREIVNLFMRTYGIPAAAFFSKVEDSFFRSGPQTLVLSDEQLRETSASDEPMVDDNRQIALVPVRLGGQEIGSLGIAGNTLSKGALNAVAYLIAIGIERAHALEEASRIEVERQGEMLKSAVLDTLAHELKTPLTSIKGALTHLMGKEHKDEEKELLTLANEETDRLGSLITEIIEMARIEAGKFQIQRRRSTVSEIVSAALRDFAAPLRNRHVALKIDDTLPDVEVDFDLIQQAIKQILDNAVKYSPPESPLEIRAEAGEGKVIVSVTDHGKGIDDQEQRRVFDKFYRGSQWRQEVPGTGLGLAIARGMVEAHGGNISMVSQPGAGSTFSISLPAFSTEPSR